MRKRAKKKGVGARFALIPSASIHPRHRNKMLFSAYICALAALLLLLEGVTVRGADSVLYSHHTPGARVSYRMVSVFPPFHFRRRSERTHRLSQPDRIPSASRRPRSGHIAATSRCPPSTRPTGYRMTRTSSSGSLRAAASQSPGRTVSTTALAATAVAEFLDMWFHR